MFPNWSKMSRWTAPWRGDLAPNIAGSDPLHKGSSLRRSWWIGAFRSVPVSIGTRTKEDAEQILFDGNLEKSKV